LKKSRFSDLDLILIDFPHAHHDIISARSTCEGIVSYLDGILSTKPPKKTHNLQLQYIQKHIQELFSRGITLDRFIAIATKWAFKDISLAVSWASAAAWLFCKDDDDIGYSLHSMLVELLWYYENDEVVVKQLGKSLVKMRQFESNDQMNLKIRYDNKKPWLVVKELWRIYLKNTQIMEILSELAIVRSHGYENEDRREERNKRIEDDCALFDAIFQHHITNPKIVAALCIAVRQFYGCLTDIKFQYVFSRRYGVKHLAQALTNHQNEDESVVESICDAICAICSMIRPGDKGTDFDAHQILLQTNIVSVLCNVLEKYGDGGADLVVVVRACEILQRLAENATTSESIATFCESVKNTGLCEILIDLIDDDPGLDEYAMRRRLYYVKLTAKLAIMDYDLRNDLKNSGAEDVMNDFRNEYMSFFRSSEMIPNMTHLNWWEVEYVDRYRR
jgi:hypothetical protein